MSGILHGVTDKFMFAIYITLAFNVILFLLLYSTVRSLGVLSGQQLLGMNKQEIRTVCPEEGGKVFFQLQAVKSAIAVSKFVIIRAHSQLNVSM